MLSGTENKCFVFYFFSNFYIHFSVYSFSGATDKDSKTDNLTFYLITQESNNLGYLSLQQESRHAISRFTQKDLELNRLYFTHQGKSSKIISNFHTKCYHWLKNRKLLSKGIEKLS